MACERVGRSCRPPDLVLPVSVLLRVHATEQSCHFLSASCSTFLSTGTRRPEPQGRSAQSCLPGSACRLCTCPCMCELVPLLYPTKPACLSIVARPVKSKSDQPSPSINACDSNSQHHEVGPPASSLPLRPPPFSSLPASTAGPWRRTRKRRTARWPTHSNKVSSKRRRVMDGWAFNAPLPFSPRLRRMPVCCRPPHHLAITEPSWPALRHRVWPFQPRPGSDPC